MKFQLLIFVAQGVSFDFHIFNEDKFEKMQFALYFECSRREMHVAIERMCLTALQALILINPLAQDVGFSEHKR